MDLFSDLVHLSGFVDILLAPNLEPQIDALQFFSFQAATGINGHSKDPTREREMLAKLHKAQKLWDPWPKVTANNE